jgi:hypothetical protein
MLKLTLIAVASAAALVGAASQAVAAPPEFCERYAHDAVRQNHEARDHERCRDAIRDQNAPGRWSDDYRAHYDWCRGVSREQADAERAARADTLRMCRRPRGGY